MALPAVFEKKLLVVAGKGGVGRTTVAAALALAASKQGKRVLICQSRSRDRLSHLFGSAPIGPRLTRVRENLWAVNMTPEMALREYGTMVLKSEFISKRVLENKISRAFLRAVPGLEDYSMLGKTWYHTTEMEAGHPRWDLVIFDGPATGHLVTMLRIPQVILSTVPEGPLTGSALATKQLLEDEARACAILVTLAEDLPSNETVELYARLRAELHMHVGPLIINSLYPARFETGASATLLARALPLINDTEVNAANDMLEPLLQVARTAHRRRVLNQTYRQRLAESLPLPQVALPYIFQPDFGPEALAELADGLVKQLPN